MTFLGPRIASKYKSFTAGRTFFYEMTLVLYMSILQTGKSTLNGQLGNYSVLYSNESSEAI
jgi:hypothetical protein